MHIPAIGKLRREVIFGLPTPRKMDRNDKYRLQVYCRAYNARLRKPGQHKGPLTYATMAVLDALVTHINWATGHTYPALKTIAAGAGCSVATVQEALKALETAGILTWVNRIVRARMVGYCPLTGARAVTFRPRRTSNAYIFKSPWKSSGYAGSMAAKPPKNVEKSYDASNPQETPDSIFF